jgi:hypothetical protein
VATTHSLTSDSATVPVTPAIDPSAFPFRCELSLAPLITFWTQTSAYHEFGRGPIPGIVREKAREAPELAGVIDDLSVIEKHRAFVDLMMTAMFPPAFWEQEYGAALFPFELRAFYATPPFRRVLMSADGHLQGRASFLQAHSVAQTLAGARRRRRHRTGPALPAAARLALRERRGPWSQAAAGGGGAAAPPDRPRRR